MRSATIQLFENIAAMERLEKFLHDEFGLSLESIGRERTLLKVSRLMAGLGFGDSAEYIKSLQRSDEQRQRLLDSVTVSESWFFRDEAPFAHLAQWSVERRQTTPVEPLHLLSIPCAGGEEAYSMAITLLRSGIGDNSFSIDAVDLNGRLVESAKEGLYGSHSFRGVKMETYSEFLIPSQIEGRHEVTARVKDRIRFVEGNLFMLDPVLGGQRYDAIFCRNLLIYFSAEAQLRALEILRSRLKPGGILFLGHAEAGKNVLELFESCGAAGSFSFRPRRTSSAPTSVHNGGGDQKARRTNKTAPKAPSKRSARSASRARKTTPSTEDKAFAELQSLADAGELIKAAQQCEMLVEHAWGDARVLYLCGVVNEACGQHEKACQLYRRALEVDPRHREVMFHLAATLEARGDTAEALELKKLAGDMDDISQREDSSGN